MTEVQKEGKELIIRVCIERDGGMYHAYAPDLKGIHVGGETEEEAFRNVQDAVYAYLESLMKHGEPFPTILRKLPTKNKRSSFIHRNICEKFISALI
ncbi:MAG: type II toxin-antitoxin system HicB family antitoxin [Firmicutes bacterium]|nr:type II toxin-antitoxin system HicB family antitoxin [Bacillota bacterium]